MIVTKFPMRGDSVPRLSSCGWQTGNGLVAVTSREVTGVGCHASVCLNLWVVVAIAMVVVVILVIAAAVFIIFIVIVV